MRLFYGMSRTFTLLAGPSVFALLLILAQGQEQIQLLAVLLWMLIWWITSAVPIGVTALLPIPLFPLLGIMSIEAVTPNYANRIIYLFFGGFLLGLALEKWQVHKRIALNIMKKSGDRPQRVILGAMTATALLSMWISNTATTVMMLPIGMSVLALLDDKMPNARAGKHFGLNLMLGIAFAANIGGMATLIGTPPNLVLAGLIEEAGLAPIDFASWLGFALPLVIVLFLLVYLVGTRIIFPIRMKKIEGLKPLIREELNALGKMNRPEKRVSLVMLGAALAWIFRSQLNRIAALQALDDTIIAVAAGVLLFALPAGTRQKQRLLTWEDTKRLPWGILLLFGGGISLAKGMEATQMVQLVADWIGAIPYPHLLLLLIVICAFSVLLTELMSNVALVSVFIPVALVMAGQLGALPLQLAVPLTLGASCAFMFPIATPPNAIVFSSGRIKMKEMARLGLWLNILSILIISLYCYFLQGWLL